MALAAPTLSISLRIRVAECADAAGKRAPVRPAAWVDEHLAAVRSLLAPHGIDVTARSEPFRPARCEALSREDRDAFATHVASDGEVTVLVVPRVRDLDVPSYDLRGVHWRAGSRRWVFLTARARPPVLAHEIGHFFGLPHDPGGGNLMTPGPSSPAWRGKRPPRPFAPLFTPDQARRLRAGIAAFTSTLAAPGRSGRQRGDVAGEVGR
jgi:hypothetical protein